MSVKVDEPCCAGGLSGFITLNSGLATINHGSVAVDRGRRKSISVASLSGKGARARARLGDLRWVDG